ncbi:MAG: hypothetical protein HKN16_12735 [Saprospiraceae bacterium]|nr:hypothetical protein [Saprospiraceae bacterium]
MSKKEKGDKKPQLHKDLKGFDIHINEFGEIVTNKPIENLNEFLDEHVEDKKLKDQKGEEE